MNRIANTRFVGFKCIPEDELLQNILQRHAQSGGMGITVGGLGQSISSSAATLIEPSSLHKYSHDMRALQFEFFDDNSQTVAVTSASTLFDNNYNMNLTFDSSYSHHYHGSQRSLSASSTSSTALGTNSYLHATSMPFRFVMPRFAPNEGHSDAGNAVPTSASSTKSFGTSLIF